MTSKASHDNPALIPFLKRWQLILAVVLGILHPAVTATGAYYGLKFQIEEKDRAMSDRISRLELDDQKSFIDKQSFHELSQEVKQMHDDVVEIKTILKSRHR